MQKRDKILRIVLSVLFTAAFAMLSAAFVDSSSEWYKALRLPALQPPGLVFTAVWAVLYALFAASLSLYAISPESDNRTLYIYAAVHLLGALWTYAFFQRQNPAGAFFVLAAMTTAAVMLYARVYRKNTTAAYLLIPYVVWLFFALYLNYEVAFLN